MKLKKIVLIVLCIFLLTGCMDNINTPSREVEEFMSKYQNLDEDVLTQLDSMLDSEVDFNDGQRKEYKALMIKQYQNLSYKITDEKTENDTATVDIEIEVFDYKTSLSKSKEYYDTHKDEFKDSEDESSKNKYIDYRISKMKDVTEKAVYTITFNLTKEDGEWEIDDITDIDRQKIHGLY